MSERPLLDATPSALGYRMPPEWAPHEATWLTWPHQRETWPGCFEKIPDVFAAMAQALAPTEEVRIVAHDEAVEEAAREALAARGVDPSRVRFFRIPNDDAWVRDHGPIFVVRDHEGELEKAMVRFRFNAWGGKYPPYDKDALVAERIATSLERMLFLADVVLEGGSIDVNGEGTVLTTEQCLLNPNRNPHLDREALEDILRSHLRVRQVIWLGDGIAGDDTDGHIDDITRFVGPRTIVTAIEADPADENHAPLQQNLERLQAARDPEGRPFEIVTLPMPPAVFNEEGDRLPASYANFYLANGVCLMPAYSEETDEQAREVLARLLPGRRIVPIPCNDLVAGLGAIHCVTQQEPRADR